MKLFKVYLALILLCNLFNISINAQEQIENPFDFFKKLQYFNSVANNKSDKLVFRLLQYNAPYRGGYLETTLNKDGTVFTVRVTQFARQAQRSAELTESQIQELNQKLLDFTSSNCNENSDPKDNELHSVLVFNKNNKFLRCNFNGQIPGDLQEIRDFLNLEYEKAEKKYLEEVIAKEKIVREKYGDWENNPQLIRYGTSGSRSLENKNTSVIYQRGKQQPVTETSKEIPVYYALIKYPDGNIVGGAGGGTWSFEPISRNGITWEIRNGSEKFRKELVFEYNVIDNSVSITSPENPTFQLSKGNLFIVKFDRNWKIKVSQLKIFIDNSMNEQAILSIFGKELGETLVFPSN